MQLILAVNLAAKNRIGVIIRVFKLCTTFQLATKFELATEMDKYENTNKYTLLLTKQIS